MPFLGSAHGAVSYGRARRGASWVNGGVVTTLAGSGSASFADGTGTNASFRYPSDAALLPDGNIVVAASHDHRIRIVTPAGVVTTLAGNSQSFANGTGTNAGFNYPSGVAVIPSANIIVVADQGNHRIRLVTYPGGVVTPLAGSGSQTFADGTGAGASFSSVSGVAILPDGNLVVPDPGNNRIRLVTYPGGVVTTLAGSGSPAFADGTGAGASFNNPIGVAILPDGNIVVPDFANHRIRLVTYPGGVVTTIAGSSPGFANGTGTSASFGDPIRVAVTSTGVIVVSDRGNQRVRLVTYPGGVVTTLAGGSGGGVDGTGTAAGFLSPVGLFIAPSGTIVLVDQDGCRIRLIT